MTDSVPDAGDVSLLDIAVILAEAWRLLVFGTLIAGGLTYAAATLQPRQYIAEATIALYPADMADLRSTTVLDAAIRKLNPAARADDIAEIRAALAEGLQVSGSNPIAVQGPLGNWGVWDYVDARSRVTFTGASPQGASDGLSAILSAFASGPGQQRLSAIRQPFTDEIKALETALALRVQAEASLRDRLVDSAPEGAAELAAASNALAVRSAQIRDRIAALRQRLIHLPTTLTPAFSGAGRAVVPHRDTLYAIAAAVFALALLTVFVLARSGLRAAGQDPRSQAKIARIRAAMPFGSRARDASS